MPSFQLNNAGPGDVLIAAAVPGQRYRVRTFDLGFQDGNGCQFRSGLLGPTISGLMVGVKGQQLTPGNTGGYKGFTTEPGAPLVLAITGSGTITGEIQYDLLNPA